MQKVDFCKTLSYIVLMASPCEQATEPELSTLSDAISHISFIDLSVLMHGSENDDTVAYVVVPDSSQMHVRAQVQMLSHGSLNLCLEITSTAICDEKK